ncbi:methyltransferase domain-containing protein [bacterium]|nr:methyltransferase domain-containing protein [bacterium]
MRTAPGPDRRFFDLWARVYDLPVVQRAAYWPIHDAVVAALAERPPRRVLDLGCGTGQLADRLQRAWRGARVTGCDFSAGMLAQARRRSRRVRWVRGDAQRLPFADRRFDAVVTTEAFHWFPDQRRALAECRRVLAPDGRLLLAVASPPFAVVADLAAAASRLVGEPFRWPTAGEIRDHLEAAGFRVETQRRIFRLPGLLMMPVLTVATPRRRRRRGG